MGYWMDNAMADGKGEPAHILLDMGYVNAPEVVERAERLIAVIGSKYKGKKNGEIAGFGRLLIRIPPLKLAEAMANFPEIKPRSEQPGYSWTTHTWLVGEAANIKYAAS